MLKIKMIIRNIYYNIRYGFERVYKGYDSTDVFDLNLKFVDRYYKILNEFKRQLDGHPPELTKEEWICVIDDMINHLYYMNEENVYNKLRENASEDWYPHYKEVSNIINEHKESFFKLFSQHFYDLWD